MLLLFNSELTMAMAESQSFFNVPQFVQCPPSLKRNKFTIRLFHDFQPITAYKNFTVRYNNPKWASIRPSMYKFVQLMQLLGVAQLRKLAMYVYHATVRRQCLTHLPGLPVRLNE